MIITSENLYPRNTHSCIFELSLADAFIQSGTEVSLLSVYLITPKNLFKAVLVKACFGLKANLIANRFSFGMLLKLTLGYLFLGRKVMVFCHQINGLTVWESISIYPVPITRFELFEPAWVNAGRQAFLTIPSEQRPDIIHAHSRFFLAASLANDLFHRYAIPYVVTEHSSYYFRGMVPANLIPFIRKVYIEAAAITAVSRVLAEKVNDVLKTNIPIQVIGNTLSNIYTHKPFHGLRVKIASNFIVLSVGSFDTNKNQELLIRAFAEANIYEGQLVLIGEGPLKSKLIRIANSLNIGGRVYFTGQIPKESVRDQMLSSNVLVVSSLVETFSVVVAEAHACGLPVISTPCGGPAELIEEGSGIQLTSFKVKSMAEALLQIKSEPEKYSSDSIRKNVLAKFDPKVIAKEYSTLFKNCCVSDSAI